MSRVLCRGWNRKGNAGFAIVAVALLLVGGAAALYLHSVEQGALEMAAGESREQALLQGAAQREVPTIVALAQGALFDGLGGAFAPGPGQLAQTAAVVSSTLAARLDALYPRAAAGGLTIDAHLVFARTVPVMADAELATPSGQRANMSVPTFVAVEGVVKLTVTSPLSTLTQDTGFVARFPLPTLLPASLAARLSTEASPGGRIERLVGQFAMRAAWTNVTAPTDPAWWRDLATTAIGVEAAAEFGSSGNATLDSQIAALTNATGAFEPASLYGGAITAAEPIVGALHSTVTVAGEPVRLEVRPIGCENLSVAPTRTYFDGGEVAESVWAALRVAVTGSCALTVGVTTASGSADVGPIEIPVEFDARAFVGGLPGSVLVTGEAFNNTLSAVAHDGKLSLAGAALLAAGYTADTNGSFDLNESVRAFVFDLLASAARANLPPLEDFEAFRSANEPERAEFVEGRVTLDFAEPAEVTGASVKVDGAEEGFSIVAGGELGPLFLMRGLHTLEVTADANGTTYAGGTEVVVGEGSWNATVVVAPRYDSEFLRDALARGEAVPDRAGIVALSEAGSLVGLAPPLSMTTLAQAAQFAHEALDRLGALGLGGFADGAEAKRADDASDFLKVMLGLLGAADSAHRALHNESTPIGGLAKSVATLTISSGPREFLAVTIDSVTIANAVVEAEARAITTVNGPDTITVVVPTAKVLLYLNAVASAASLAADFVKINKTFGVNSTASDADKAIVLATTATHFASITLSIARTMYAFVGRGIKDALSRTFMTLGVAVTAAMVILDIAALYQSSHGNLSAMWQALVAPQDLGGLTRLPSLVGGVASGIADILYITGAIATKGGPIGIAASLFVLAGLIVANKEKVASAIFGTLDYGQVDELRPGMGETVGVSFAGAAAANSLDVPRALQARRAANAAGAEAWLSSAVSSQGEAAASAASRSITARGRAAALGALLDASARLRFASRALVEQADDFASPPFDTAPGRNTEGYRALHTLGGWFNYSGDVVVNQTMANGSVYTLGRASWRGWLEHVTDDTLPALSFEWTIAETNAIDADEYARWAQRLSAAGNEFTLWAAEYQIAANALAAQA